MTLASGNLEQLRDKVPEAAELLRQLANPNRLLLLCHIASQERSVGELEQDLGIKQPGLSQQLAELRQAGLVKTRRQSRSIYYSIADERTRNVLTMLWVTFCQPEGVDIMRAQTVQAATVDTPALRTSGAANFARVLG